MSMEMRVHEHLAKIKTLFETYLIFCPFCVCQFEGHMMQWIVSMWYNLLMHKEVKWYSFSIILKYFCFILGNHKFKVRKPFVSTDPDNKVHGANMEPTWVLPAPDGPHVPCYYGREQSRTDLHLECMLEWPLHVCINHYPGSIIKMTEGNLEFKMLQLNQ